MEFSVCLLSKLGDAQVCIRPLLHICTCYSRRNPGDGTIDEMASPESKYFLMVFGRKYSSCWPAHVPLPIFQGVVALSEGSDLRSACTMFPVALTRFQFSVKRSARNS